MPRVRVAPIGALSAIAFASAVSTAAAQIATTGSPLAGLNPPHQGERHAPKLHIAMTHAAATHVTTRHVTATHAAARHEAMSYAETTHEATSHVATTRAVKMPAHREPVHVAGKTHHGRTTRIAERTSGRHDRHVAHEIAAAEGASLPTASTVMPQNNSPAPAFNAAANTRLAAPVADATPAIFDPGPRAVAVNGQAVQVSPPNEINDIDQAVGDRKVTAQDQTATLSDGGGRTAASPADDDFRSLQSFHRPQSGMTEVAAAAITDGNDQQLKSTSASKVGSTSWIAEVLTALGGAVAAGVVAWFLIGSGPIRTYS